jgi:hypothetical protein
MTKTFLPKKWYKREICFDTKEERGEFDNLIKNLKYKTGENNGKIVMTSLLKYREGLK